MSASLDQNDGKPNLTPILDMVFQLITFFMLVINFKSASMDMSLKLPVIGSARPLDTKGQDDILVLNIDKKGRLNIYGGIRDDVETYISGEALASMKVAQRANPAFKRGDPLPTIVVIRADRSTPFSLLNNVLEKCRENGYLKFSFKALSAEAKGGGREGDKS